MQMHSEIFRPKHGAQWYVDFLNKLIGVALMKKMGDEPDCLGSLKIQQCSLSKSRSLPVQVRYKCCIDVTLHLPVFLYCWFLKMQSMTQN